ncbi:MAG: type I restriction enzyme HsdR N-terminal domain-containing protein [Bacteroidota bacterium]
MALPVLNFPNIEFRFRQNEKGTLQLFDIIRKKFVDVTPEEWVRQHIVHYLIDHKQVPASVISLEKQLILNNTKRRTDIVIFNAQLKPLMIIECKAPEIKVDQLTIDQALRYNLQLNVSFLFLSNGFNHICVQLENNNPKILKNLPNYSEMLNL